MTQAEAAAALIQGSTATNSQYVTVRRDHLLLALGAVDPHAAKHDPDAPTDQPAADVS